MLQARLRLGAALVGFLIVVAELGFGVYALIWTYRWTHDPLVLVGHISTVHLYLPASLLALASLLGGIALCRTIRGRSRWSDYAIALTPVAGFLAVYQPPMSLGQMAYAINTALPWVAPAFWSQKGNYALSLALQIALYLATAAYVLAIALAIPHRRPRRHKSAGVPPNSLSAP